jgi:TonB-linked SusC/RagA family outer membrane protein
MVNGVNSAGLSIPPTRKLFQRIKLLALFLSVATLQVTAKGFGQGITLSISNASIVEAFNKIEKQSGYFFMYNKKQLEQAKPVTLHLLNASLEQALDACFRGQPFTYAIQKKLIIVKEKNDSYGLAENLVNVSQSNSLIDVRGRVLNEGGSPVASVTVSVKGTATSTVTDMNGEFSLTTIDEDAVLVFTHISMETFELKVSGKKELLIKLKTKVSELGNVMVTVSTGYEEIPKERATGSFTTVDNKRFNEQVGTNVLDRLPVVTNSMSAMPYRIFKSSQITIRGLSTLSGSISPLIILNNFPYEGDINNINPNDVESVTLLKDAAAASIWGAKAGNGVIVINTKKGKFNQPLSIEFNSNISVSEKPDLYYLKNISTSDFIDVEKFLFSNNYRFSDTGQANRPPFTPVYEILFRERNGLISSEEAAASIDRLRAIDVRDDFSKYFYQNAVNQQHSVSLRGGSENVNYFLSTGIDRNINNLDAFYQRINIRSENSYRLSKLLQLTAGLFFIRSVDESGKPGYLSFPSSTGGHPPYLQLVDANGKSLPITTNLRRSFVDTAGSGKLLDWNFYPMENYKYERIKRVAQEIIANVGLNIKILPLLSADVKYQYERQQVTEKSLYDQKSYFARNLINTFTQIDYSTGQITYKVPVGSILDYQVDEVTAHNIRGQLNYNATWNNHSITMTAGGEIRSVNENSNRHRTYGYNEKILTTGNVDFANQYPSFVSGSLMFIPNNTFLNNFTDRFVSVYANAAYTFKRRYVLSLSARRDASNLLGVSTNKKWNPLWSAGASWQISEESFYKFSTIPYLKFRTTYGYSGNVDPNQSAITTIRYTSLSQYTQMPRARINGYVNPGLTWEKVGMVNFGIDFAAKGNFLSGSIDFFLKNAKDLYSFIPVDRTLGLATSAIRKNAASLKGRGVDVELNSINTDGAVRWTSHLNLNYYKDKVDKFYTTSLRAEYYVGGTGGAVEGYPLYSLFTYRWGGLDPNTGDPQGYVNGNISKKYSALIGDSAEVSDLVYHGSVLPTLYGSFGNSITWKNFTLTARITYQFGYYFLRESINYNDLFYSYKGHSDFSKRWQKPGDEEFTNVPSMIYSSDYYRDYFYINSEVLATKGDHIRLQYLNLSVNVLNRRSASAYIKSLRLYFVANNLGIIWKANSECIDPLFTNGQIPAPRSYSFGINIQL